MTEELKPCLEAIVWVRKDQLQRALRAPFLCEISPQKYMLDFVPLYARAESDEVERLKARIAELEFNQCIHPDGLGIGRDWKGAPYCRLEDEA